MPNSLMDAIEASASKLNNNQIQWWEYKWKSLLTPMELSKLKKSYVQEKLKMVIIQ